MHNVTNVQIPTDGSPLREFRVSKVDRYQVTDWTDFRGGAGTRVIASDLTLAQAHDLAVTYGTAHPGALVNTMEAATDVEIEPVVSRDEQIKQMVDRFLGWPLPENFNPDGGVSFQPVGNAGTAHEYFYRPLGTNLLDAGQAETMVRHILGSSPVPESVRHGSNFRKKDTVIEACRWEGARCGLPNGVGPMWEYPLPQGLRLTDMQMPPVSRVSEVDREFDYQSVPAGEVWRAGNNLYIGTTEGTRRADPGDWIVRGPSSQLRVCKPDVFAATYEPA